VERAAVNPSEQPGYKLGDLLQDGIDVPHHSPARNQRLLASLAACPDAVCAHVPVRLLECQYMAFAHYDVLFASMIKAARRLPVHCAPACLRPLQAVWRAFLNRAR
jgi:hypothetical protein